MNDRQKEYAGKWWSKTFDDEPLSTALASSKLKEIVRDRFNMIRNQYSGRINMFVYTTESSDIDSPAKHYFDSLVKYGEDIGVRVLLCDCSRISHLSYYDDMSHADGILELKSEGRAIPNLIDEFKGIADNADIDGAGTVSYANRRHLSIPELMWNGYKYEGTMPATALATLWYLGLRVPDLTGMNVVILGRSERVGRPIAEYLIGMENCTVSVLNSHSDPVTASDILHSADVVISATGQARSIKGSMLNEHAVILDVGMTAVEGKLVGDVDVDSLLPTQSCTPVRKGIGAITTPMLFLNLSNCVIRRHGLDGE